MGCLGKDPESRSAPTGNTVTHFSLAVSERWKSVIGESDENTEWVNVEAWGRSASSICTKATCFP
jgi:single-strand DNA-binding protein